MHDAADDPSNTLVL